MNPNDTVVDIQSLSLRANDIHILSGITLAIPRGAVVGLVGRNGAGKSSLLKCIVGLAVPSEGSARLLGHASLDLPDDVLERLGYVAQTPDLFEWMEVIDMLKAVGQAYPRWTLERCIKLATHLGLPMGTQIKNLSGGDQQKMAVVLALAHDPDVLLLDEPVSNLDPLTRSDFMRALFIGRTGDADGTAMDNERTIIISSHLLHDLERVVSHVAFIRDGRLQLFETWDAILENFRLVPSTQQGIADNAVVCRNAKNEQIVIDTRLAAQHITAGRALTLDEIFAELNV
jgi:ABC-2 type transport system ATP-binding protein